MHNCNPLGHSRRFMCFITMLSNPIKVYTYSIDGEDYCRTCRKGILIPSIYYNMFINSLYVVVGAVQETLISSSFSPLPRTIVRVLVLCAFHHITAAIIFSFSDWKIYDNSKFSPRYANSKATKSTLAKVACYLIGMSVIGLM